MMRYFFRLVIITVVFYSEMPLIPGAHFHGSMAQALLFGLLISLIGTFIEYLAIVFSHSYSICTLKGALCYLIPAWIIGFGVLPVILLKCLASFMSPTFVIVGWNPAIAMGILILSIGIITGGYVYQQVMRKILDPKLPFNMA